MKLRTFYGKNVKEAIDQAKMNLGSNVTVLESKEIQGNGYLPLGKNFVRITATVTENSDRNNESDNQIPPSLDNTNHLQFSDYISKSIVKERSNGFDKLENNEFITLLNEMNILTRRLRKMTSPELPEKYNKIYERLLDVGISEDHASSLIRRAYLKLEDEPDRTSDKILEAVKSSVLAIFNEQDILQSTQDEGRQIVTLIGPTGAGKTTTLMKLAIHPSIYGQKKVAIISTDMYRVGAHEPLNAFSKLTMIPVAEVRNPEEIPTLIDRFIDRDVILVDTAGRSPFFPNYIQDLQQYLTMIDPNEILLVLSLTTDLNDLSLLSGLYLTLNPTGVIYTKMDETCRVGKIISMRKEINLPVCFTSDGQSIPDNIRLAEGEYIWERIIKSG